MWLSTSSWKTVKQDPLFFYMAHSTCSASSTKLLLCCSTSYLSFSLSSPSLTSHTFTNAAAYADEKIYCSQAISQAPFTPPHHFVRVSVELGCSRNIFSHFLFSFVLSLSSFLLSLFFHFLSFFSGCACFSMSNTIPLFIRIAVERFDACFSSSLSYY